MGIPSYFANLIKSDPEIFKRCWNGTASDGVDSVTTGKRLLFERAIDQLGFDSNSIIYDVVREMESPTSAVEEMDESAIIRRVIAKIDEYVRMFRPAQRVVIAFDGVAPMAKLEQQRQRRFKSYFEKTYFQRFAGRDESSVARREMWNTAAITPGTTFMRQLSREIDEYYAPASPHLPPEFSHLQFILSTAEEAGEGEHKLFAIFRDSPREWTTVVYGLDADLFMLSLNHLMVHRHLYLYRETPEYIQSLQNDLDPKEDYLIDIWLLMQHLQEAMTTRDDAEPEAISSAIASPISTPTSFSIRYMRDYIFMCFFLGNDFMPHFPALNIRTKGVEKLLDAYKCAFPLGIDGELLRAEEEEGTWACSCFVAWHLDDAVNQTFIRWSNVMRWIQVLAANEETYLRKEHFARDQMEKRMGKHLILDRLDDSASLETRTRALNAIPMSSREVEKYIEGGMGFRANSTSHKVGAAGSWQQRYYDKLLGMQIQNDSRFVRREQLCHNYLEGLEWTFLYYSFGCCDFRWKYKYRYPPLLSDLCTGLGTLLEKKKTDGWRWAWKTHSLPVSPTTQLAYVLPRESLATLIQSEHLTHQLLTRYSKWYVVAGEGRFEWAYCKYFWESHAHLPEMDIEELEAVVADAFHEC